MQIYGYSFTEFDIFDIQTYRLKIWYFIQIKFMMLFTKYGCSRVPCLPRAIRFKTQEHVNFLFISKSNTYCLLIGQQAD
jgi:hypothetical protein